MSWEAVSATSLYAIWTGKIFVHTGYTLVCVAIGFVLGLFLGRDLPLPELIDEVVNSGKNSICYCNRIVEEVMEEEFNE